ncbi:hypothetical protein [Streptomyces sp. NPDC014622]|uniref:hypothetical protein n=1 Tax=Streptomyces sp. NPDC014622 TaxID=3364874 RepID=UPI0036FF9949
MDAIDPGWCPAWDIEWQRCYRLVQNHVQASGALPAAAGTVIVQGEDLGRWHHDARKREAPAVVVGDDVGKAFSLVHEGAGPVGLGVPEMRRLVAEGQMGLERNIRPPGYDRTSESGTPSTPSDHLISTSSHADGTSLVAASEHRPES